MIENSENSGDRLLYSFESIFLSRAVFVKRESVDGSYLVEVHKGSGNDKKLHQGLVLQSQTYERLMDTFSLYRQLIHVIAHGELDYSSLHVVKFAACARMNEDANECTIIQDVQGEIKAYFIETSAQNSPSQTFTLFISAHCIADPQRALFTRYMNK